jgi:hypothetical protein
VGDEQFLQLFPASTWPTQQLCSRAVMKVWATGCRLETMALMVTLYKAWLVEERDKFRNSRQRSAGLKIAWEGADTETLGAVLLLVPVLLTVAV